MPLGRSLLIIRPVDTNLVWAGNSAGFAVAVAPELFALEKRATSLGGFQFANPDVAVAHWMVMVLQRQRQFFWLRFVRRQLAVFRKTRPVEDNVVGLPLARRARSVH